MPLPKRPAKRGDVLTDYGPEADLTKPAGKAAPKAAAKPSQAPETASKPRRTTRKTVKAAPAETTKTVEKTVTAQETAAPKSTAKTPAKPAVKKPPVKKAATAVKPQTAPAVAESDVRESRHSNRRGRAATPADKRKLFVLDTNVLIHDPMSIFSFAEHDVFLPMTVLEELDNHKKGTSDVARNARSVSRNLDQLMELNGHDLTQGVPLSLLGNKEATGRLFFETHAVDVPIPAALPTFKGDNRILAVVKGVEGAFPDLAVVLVSKDINMRIKATTLGIPAEDYLSDKVLDDTDMLYSGRMALPSDFWTTVGKSLKSWQDDGTTHYRFETKEAGRYVVNMCLTIEGDPDFMAIVTSVEPDAVTIRLLRDYRTRLKVWGIHARNTEQNMALNLLTDPEIDFVTLLGQAGTGKTLMTLAAALTQTIDERRFSEIIVTRATVSVGEDIGFLPVDGRARGQPRGASPLGKQHGRRLGSTGDARPHQGPHPHQVDELHARTHLPQEVRHHRRGAEPEPEADEDPHHARGPRHEDRLSGQHRPDRYALPDGRQLRPHLRRRTLPGLAARSHDHAHARRTLASGGLRD